MLPRKRPAQSAHKTLRRPPRLSRQSPEVLLTACTGAGFDECRSRPSLTIAVVSCARFLTRYVITHCSNKGKAQCLSTTTSTNNCSTSLLKPESPAMNSVASVVIDSVYSRSSLSISTATFIARHQFVIRQGFIVFPNSQIGSQPCSVSLSP